MQVGTTIALLIFFAGCKNNSPEVASTAQFDNISIAKAFVDAFYSFDGDSLESVLNMAKGSQPNILYYQKWAQCAHYQVLKRDTFFESNDSLVIFPVTVKDDLMAALKIDFNVTDTFHLSIKDGRIRAVETASNDLDVYYQAKEWVKHNKPDLIDKACEGIWNGGPTPCECVQGMLKGFAAFVGESKTN